MNEENPTPTIHIATLSMPTLANVIKRFADRY